MEYIQRFIETKTITTAYYRSGEGNKDKLLVLHGNISSSVFFLPLMSYLESKFDIVVPDLRCFGNSEALPIDATRGYRDWSDDIYAFCNALGWRKFNLLGWSMGGDIAMQFVTDHEKMVKRLILVAPGSPYGFGGTKDEKGTPHEPLGLGSGGGTANPMLTVLGQFGSNIFSRGVLYRYLFKPPFRLSSEWEDLFIKAATSMKLGQEYYPGSYNITWTWPYVVSGEKGVLNTMSPKYGNLNAFLDIKEKPPVLWIHGDHDLIVSDTSMMELGNLGRLRLVPGWPGEKVYPPQPMMAQTRYFLKQYKKRGGSYTEVEIPGGHVCIVESPDHFISALNAFMNN